MANKKILVINPGSTSTKVAVYDGSVLLKKESIKHNEEDLKTFNTIWEQYDFRKTSILNYLLENGFHIQDFAVIACRGGNLKPIPGGIYQLNEEMIKDMKSGRYGIHPTNVGNVISYDMGREYKIPVITVDPPVTDELSSLARYSGIPDIERQSSFHALNQKATARKFAEQIGKEYKDLRLIVAHLGGGISVGAHLLSKVVDVNNALDGDGPFSPERAGSLPTGDLIKMCFSGKYSQQDMLKMICGRGGLVAYLGTTDALEIESMIEGGNKKAEEVYEALAYQVSKEIGAAATVLHGDVDAILFTGSLAYSEMFIGMIKKRVSFIAEVHLLPGENELEALATGALRFLNSAEQLREY